MVNHDDILNSRHIKPTAMRELVLKVLTEQDSNGRKTKCAKQYINKYLINNILKV